MLSWARAGFATLLLFACACTDGSTDLLGGGGGADAGPVDQGTPVGSCDDGIACTEDRTAPDGTCEHVAQDFLCVNTPCSRATCEVSTGCQSQAEPDGTICADGPACQPFVCQSGECGASVAPDGAYCLDQDPCTIDDHCESGTCVGTATGDGLQIQSRTFLIDSPRHATFISDRIAVEIEAGGARLRWVAQDGEVAAPVSDLGASMDGSGQLLQTGAQAWVRLNHNPVSLELTLERITGDGNYGLSTAGGATIARRPSDAPDLVTLANNTLFFCALDTDAQVRLHALSLDLGGPLGPVVPLIAPGRHEPCQPSDNGGTTAAGAIWATWHNQGNSPQLTVYRARADGTDTLTSFSYATDGIHRYGPIESVAADPDGTVLLAVANPLWAYLFDLGNSNAINTVPLNRPPNTHLLGLRERRALFQAESELLVYDISDITQVSLTRVDVGFSPPETGSARALALDSSQAALVDGLGRLHWLQSNSQARYSRIIEVRGQGLLQDMVRFGSTYIGWSERSIIAASYDWLQNGAVGAAPVSTRRASTAAMAVIRSGQDSIIIGAARDDSHDGCQQRAPGTCPMDRALGGQEIPQYELTSQGLAPFPPALQSPGPRPVSISRREVSWHIEPGIKGGSWVTASRLSNDRLTVNSQVWAAIPPDSVQDTLLDPHPYGMTARLPNGDAFLYRDEGMGTLAVGADATVPNAIGSMWLPPYWYIVAEGEDPESRRLITYEVDADRAIQQADQPLNGYAHRVVGQAGAALYTVQSGRLEAWRVRGTDAPQSMGSVGTVSPVTRVQHSPMGTLAIRADGISVLSDTCN